MKFAFISGGNTLWLWEHLVNEGHEVGVFHTHPGEKEVGAGYSNVTIFPSMNGLLSWATPMSIVVADITDMPEDKIKICATTDLLRKAGYKVLGGGAFAEKLENKREFGREIAEAAGYCLPYGANFKTIDEAIDFLLEQDDEEWHFKTDKYLGSDVTYGCSSIEQMVKHLQYLKTKFGNGQPNHLEKTIKGPAYDIAGWFNGEKFLRPLHFTLEHKRFLEGDHGPNTGCSFNLCGPAPMEHFEAYHFDKIEKIFAAQKAAPGLYAVNTIITPEGPYFLEWTPRFGYDSEPTIMSPIDEKGMFLATTAVGIAEEAPWSGYSYGVRLTVPPYPEEDFEEKANAKEVPVIGPSYASERFAPYGLKKTEGLESFIADPYGFIGVAVDTRQDFETQKSHEEVEKFLAELKVPNMQCRHDGGLTIMHDVAELRRVGVEL